MLDTSARRFVTCLCAHP